MKPREEYKEEEEEKKTKTKTRERYPPCPSV